MCILENKELHTQNRKLKSENIKLENDIHNLQKVLNCAKDIISHICKWISRKLNLTFDKTIEKFEYDNDISVNPTEQLKREYYRELEKTTINNKPRDNTLAKYYDMPFCDYMVDWLESIKNSIERTTYIGYSQVVKGRLYSYFKEKSIKLIDLKPIHITEFYEHLSKIGLCNNTIKHYNANISKALKRAVIKEIIPSNTIDKIDNIKEKQSKTY